MKEMKASEKVVQRITHDGAVEENLFTDEVSSISDREKETEFSAADESETVALVLAEIPNRYHRQKARKTAKAGTLDRTIPRLRFSAKDLKTPELEEAIHRSEKAAEKLSQSQIRFQEAAKKPNGNLRHGPLSRPIQELRSAAHSQIRENEHENVGVEAAYKTEELAEQSIYFAGDHVPSTFQHHQTAVVRAEKLAIRANADFLYHKTVQEDPKLATANPLSKYLQKQRIRRGYAKQVYQAEKNAQNTAAPSRKTVRSTREAVRRTAIVFKRHSKGALLVVGVGAILVMLLGGISSCSMMATSSVGSIVSSSYFSDDANMLAAEAAYCAMEADLQEDLDNYEERNPGYDQYHFELDDIEHDPYVLISILSALHDGIFTLDEVGADLVMLFDKQYILTETVETETRYRTESRTETITVTDPETGEVTTEEQEVEVEVPYTYSICNVELENFNLSHVPIYIMSQEQLSMYATYMSTLGNREDLFPDSDYISLYITNPPADYEVPAEYLDDETFALILAEAEKYLGYPYVWGGSSPSTSFDCSGYVSWVLTHTGVCNTGRLGAQGLYNISTPVSSANAQPGDLIFFEGTYDTDGVSHVGIYVGAGMMIHCGDPIQYANINSSYWQAHFYAFARPPYN